MEHSATRAEAALNTVNQQVAQTLAAMHALTTSADQCDSSLYLQIAQLAEANRFISEAAILQANGAACSSYGHEIRELPSSSDSHYFPGYGLDFWFFSDNTTSLDNGFIIVSRSGNYLWLNKGIVLSAFGLTENLAFDIVDTHQLMTVFASSQPTIKFTKAPLTGVLLEDGESIHYAVPNQWSPRLVSVLTMPKSSYQSIWWCLFALTLSSSTVLSLTLYFYLRRTRRRSCSVIPKLRQALKHNGLQLNYQPIINMKTGEWVGVETLIRWSRQGQPIPPAVFIPAAERAGIIGEVTRWVVRQVAEDFSRYLWACKGLYITINLSAQDVEDEFFADFVRELLSEYAIPAQLIIFEVTENALLDREKATIQLQRLREQGHRIAVDDFGTGYCSLSYISELPVDILKIDRSFLGLEKMQADDGLWRHVIDMANTLSLTVVAEGIEQAEQAELLAREGVQFAQGWLYSRELPAELVAKQFFHLRNTNCLAGIPVCRLI